jgi:hypothetical protein
MAKRRSDSRFLANVGLDLTDQRLGSRLFTNVGLTLTKRRSALGYLPTLGLNIWRMIVYILILDLKPVFKTHTHTHNNDCKCTAVGLVWIKWGKSGEFRQIVKKKKILLTRRWRGTENPTVVMPYLAQRRLKNGNSTVALPTLILRWFNDVKPTPTYSRPLRPFTDVGSTSPCRLGGDMSQNPKH